VEFRLEGFIMGCSLLVVPAALRRAPVDRLASIEATLVVVVVVEESVD
jgi:hypothetical protein